MSWWGWVLLLLFGWLLISIAFAPIVGKFLRGPAPQDDESEDR